MTTRTTPAVAPAAEVFDDLPAVRDEPGARARIRAARAATGQRVAVLDDDPTGSQSVHGVDVVTVFEPEQYAKGLSQPGSTCFILTNTRGLPEEAAVRMNTSIGLDLFALGDRIGSPLDVVSRSDSTLRGHLVAEVRALDGAKRAATGTGFDGVILAPAYFEAGRVTAGDVHWARIRGNLVPVGDTEFAQDSTFGYTSSNLRDFVAEKSCGTVAVEDVVSISLDDIRVGGPVRVSAILQAVTGGAFVVVNATCYADLEIVVLALLEAQEAGRSFLFRTGPSFVRALSGVEPRPVLGEADIWPQGHPGGHGLVVVGSHVGLTSRQVLAAQERGGLAEVELHVPTLADPLTRNAHLAETAAQVVEALASTDVLLFTSRTLVRGGDADDSLAISRNVSTAVTEVVRAALAARPSWIVAKGGITSHDVAVRGLGIRHAEVLGQLLPGMVSVFRPLEAAPEAVGMPYVVFAGNVGDEQTLADVIDLFSQEK
jgi:uncharacterized protein YgbK (DUF1537 family)